MDGETKYGVYWFNGEGWCHEPYEKNIVVAMKKTLSCFGEIKIEKGWDDIKSIAALRSGMTSYRPDLSPNDAIYCSDGSRVKISDEGIQIEKGNPDRDVWTSVINVSGTDIKPNLENVGFDELCNEYPNFVQMLNVCDSDQDKQTGRRHIDLIATIAGSVLYSYFAKHLNLPALDAVFWVYDRNVSRTGKSTHVGLIQHTLGKMAAVTNLSDLMGNNPKTGNILGSAMVWADEAAECSISDTGLFKSLPSGTASLKQLYHDPTEQTSPVIIVATANGAPKIPAYKVTEALKRRLIPYRYTIQHEPASNTGCTEEEAKAAIINLGIWQCYRLIRKFFEGCSAREAWMYQTTEEDVDRMLDWVSWSETLQDMLVLSPQNSISISILRRSLVSRLVKEGRCEDIPDEVIRSAAEKHLNNYNLPSELMSDRAFRKALKGRKLTLTQNEGFGSFETHKTYRCAVKDTHCQNNRFVVVMVDFRDHNDEIQPADPQTSIACC